MSKNLPLHQNLTYMLEFSEILETMEEENKALRETLKLLERNNAEKDKMIENLQHSIRHYETRETEYRIYIDNLICALKNKGKELHSEKNYYDYGIKVLRHQTTLLNKFIKNAFKYFRITKEEVNEILSNDNFERIYVYNGEPQPDDYTLFGIKKVDIQQLAIEAETFAQPMMPSLDFNCSDPLPPLEVFDPPILDKSDEKPQTEPLRENTICIFCQREMSLEQRLDICYHCKKYFHETCFSEWLIDNSACPNCRKPIPLEQEEKYLNNIVH